MLYRFVLGLVCLVLLIPPLGPVLAQGSRVDEFGEVAGENGRAEATITIAEGGFATLIATAQITGKTLDGTGELIRAGVGIDLYVNDRTCSADRDIRRHVQVASFEGKFASSTTCLTTLLPGTHIILAESISINVLGATMKMNYTVLNGQPEKMNVPTK